MARPKSRTADQIIAVAESQFAERGYEAASMADIARAVGIRTPSLYSHFRNKAALYEAVFERRLQPLFAVLADIGAFPQDDVQAIRLLQAVMRHYIADPKLARLIQYAVLAGDEQLDIVMERVYRPLITLLNLQMGDSLPAGQDAREARMIVVAFNSLVMGYVNFAPVYAEILGADPLQQETARIYIDLLDSLVRAVRSTV